jgi:hypothetical protein
MPDESFGGGKIWRRRPGRRKAFQGFGDPMQDALGGNGGRVLF